MCVREEVWKKEEEDGPQRETIEQEEEMWDANLLLSNKCTHTESSL